MPEENIEKQPQEELNPTIKEDLITAGNRCLEIGNKSSAIECFKKAGLTPKQIEEIEQNWLNEHPETIH